MGSVSKQSQACSRSERLSAFVDGEWADDPRHVGELLAGLDAADRAAWSEYHLIGDALRSDDLAVHPGASHGFLRGFAARLDAEPHVLAPVAVPHSASRFGLATVRRRIVPGLAVAAAAATLSWIVLPQLQRADVAPVRSAAVAPRQPSVQAVAMTGASDANIIRDARLDQYLEAHQQFGQQPMVLGSAPFIRAAALTAQGQ